MSGGLFSVLLGAAGVALARSDNVAMSRWVLSGGATHAAGGGGITVRATLGQSVVGVVASGAGQGVTLGQGFWHGETAEHAVYLPLILK